MLRVLKLDRFLASFTYTGAPTPGRTLFYQQYLAGAPTPGWTIFYQLYLHWGPLLGYKIYINITYILLRIDQTFIQKMDVLWPKKTWNYTMLSIPIFPDDHSVYPIACPSTFLSSCSHFPYIFQISLCLVHNLSISIDCRYFNIYNWRAVN